MGKNRVRHPRTEGERTDCALRRQSLLRRTLLISHFGYAQRDFVVVSPEPAGHASASTLHFENPCPRPIDLWQIIGLVCGLQTPLSAAVSDLKKSLTFRGDHVYLENCSQPFANIMCR